MDFEIGAKLRHSHRGDCVFTEMCAALQERNCDPSSIFVDLEDGEGPIEVTKSLVKRHED